MNITPDFDCQADLTIDKVQLLGSGNENIILEYIRDWDIDYDKTGTSRININFCGVSQKLLNMQRYKTRITYVKLVGRAMHLDNESLKTGSVTGSFILNIPCDMCIEELRLCTDDGFSITDITFSGDMC